VARLPYVKREDLPAHRRDRPLSNSNISRALSNSPDVAHHSGLVAKFIREDMLLDARLRELAIIQVGYSTRCAYEYCHHIEIGLAVGVTEADIRAIAQEATGLSTDLDPLAKLVLQAAREMTSGTAIADDTFEALRRHLDNECLVDLIFAIANYNAVVRLLESLKVDLEDAYRRYLVQFPLPEG